MARLRLRAEKPPRRRRHGGQHDHDAAATGGGAPGERRGRFASLLWVGRLNANKDPLTVLRGFAQFSEGAPNAVLTMVFGPADLLPEVEREIARTPVLQTRVRAVGVVAHELLAACYSAADVFVLGSHAEGSGHTLIEAMACGMVPVVTDIPSFRALADDGRVGAPWSPGDPKWLAAALTVSGGRRRLPGRAG